MHLVKKPQPDRVQALRQRAAALLSKGLAGSAAPSSPARALAVLHDLASSPDTAADAMALLHELQVHQVELELQHEELLTVKGELEVALARQTVLYDHAPVAYLTLDSGAVMRELNLAAARLLGEARDALVGQSLRRYLAPLDADRLLMAVESLRGGATSIAMELALLSGEGAPRRVLACASADTLPGQCLLMLAVFDAEASPTPA